MDYHLREPMRQHDFDIIRGACLDQIEAMGAHPHEVNTKWLAFRILGHAISNGRITAGVTSRYSIPQLDAALKKIFKRREDDDGTKEFQGEPAG